MTANWTDCGWTRAAPCCPRTPRELAAQARSPHQPHPRRLQVPEHPQRVGSKATAMLQLRTTVGRRLGQSALALRLRTPRAGDTRRGGWPAAGLMASMPPHASGSSVVGAAPTAAAPTMAWRRGACRAAAGRLRLTCSQASPGERPAAVQLAPRGARTLAPGFLLALSTSTLLHRRPRQLGTTGRRRLFGRSPSERSTPAVEGARSHTVMYRSRPTNTTRGNTVAAQSMSVATQNQRLP